MTEQFVPYSLALKLKEHGFNEQCIAMYQKNKKLWYAKKGDWLRNFEHNPTEEFFQDRKECYPEDIWTIKGIEYVNMSVNFTAPLWQQAFEWFRKEHNVMFSTVSYHCLNKDKPFGVFIDHILPNGAWGYYEYTGKGDFETYEQAIEFALNKMIELIETR
jgi:hypothetical protein